MPAFRQLGTIVPRKAGNTCRSGQWSQATVVGEFGEFESRSPVSSELGAENGVKKLMIANLQGLAVAEFPAGRRRISSPKRDGAVQANCIHNRSERSSMALNPRRTGSPRCQITLRAR